MQAQVMTFVILIQDFEVDCVPSKKIRAHKYCEMRGTEGRCGSGSRFMAFLKTYSIRCSVTWLLWRSKGLKPLRIRFSHHSGETPSCPMGGASLKCGDKDLSDLRSCMEAGGGKWRSAGLAVPAWFKGADRLGWFRWTAGSISAKL